jgi:cell division protease FtsH
VSIIPRGRALGVTFSAPDTDRISYDRQALDAKIDVALGGRVAEELVFDAVTTGAESDIEQVTGIARAMVGRWGMSERIGFIAARPADTGNPFLAAETSEETRRELDLEVKRIVDGAHDRVARLLGSNRDRLDALASLLLEKETIDQDEVYKAAGMPTPPSLHDAAEAATSPATS